MVRDNSLAYSGNENAPRRRFSSAITYATLVWALAGSIMQAANLSLQIDVVTDVDTFTFAGTNGQIIYLEGLSVSADFKGFLQWDIKRPNSATLSAGYFDGYDRGRLVLPETGIYTMRVKVGSSNTNYVGDYSFRLRAVPPDDSFQIAVGETVANGVPKVGSGNIEVPGAQDVYTFQAGAGQAAFFQDVSVAPSFKGWLQWELKAPSGLTLFRNYLDDGNEGRRNFPETGSYTLRVWSGYNDVSYVGPYSFAVLPIPPETVVPIQVGQVVGNGVPVEGAGNIEVPGAQDLYSFEGAAGQSLFFGKISSDPALGGWLQWEVLAPSGKRVFISYFSGDVGRKTLPETGTYSVRFWVGINDTEFLGKYSFKISSLEDSTLALSLGQTVTNGVPGQGAGQIETAGGQDLYSFSGNAGQKIIFQSFYAASIFGGYLQYQIRAPSSNQVAIAYFGNNHDETYVLPETGTYTVRTFAGANDAGKIGDYSYRIYSPVVAWTDQFNVAPGKSLLIPKNKFLCNDRGEAGDVLQVLLTASASTGGGTLVETNEFWRYTPAFGFSGQDSFTYQLVGAYGGSDMGSVRINVVPGADAQASVVSFSRVSSTAVDVCLLGEPNRIYNVETSTDLVQWQSVTNITADASGSLSYQFSVASGDRGFYRFLKE